MAELDPGVRALLEAIRDLLSAPPTNRGGDQGAYVKELEHRLSLVDHAVGRVLCEEPQAMADFLRNPPRLEDGDWGADAWPDDLAAREVGDLVTFGRPGEESVDTLDTFGIARDLAAHAVALAEVRIHTRRPGRW